MAPFATPAHTLTTLSDPRGRWTGWVSIDSAPVPVYQVEHKDGKTTCFVEAIEGKEFKVHIQRAAGMPYDLAVFAKVDGTSVASYSVSRSYPANRESRFEGARISATAVRPFKFAQIALTDDADEACQTEAVVKNLGTVQLDMFRTEILGRRVSRVTYADAKQPVVDEKSKKATMSHSTAYGEAKHSVVSDEADSVHWIDQYGGSPHYTLEFKYRSRALLELEGVVEPLAEPSPPPARATSASGSASGSGSPAVNRKKRKPVAISLSPDGDDEDGDDLRAKVARLEAENSRLRAGGVKKEKEDVKPKVPKGEPIGKVIKENGRTVIDLLDEDSD